MGHDDDEDNQRKDEDHHCQSNEEAFALSGISVHPAVRASPIATAVAAAAVAAAAIAAAVTAAAVSRHVSTHAGEGAGAVMSQRGRHAGEYGHAQDDDDDGHDLDDARRRRPAVEVLELVIGVVGVGRLSRADAEKQHANGENSKTGIRQKKPNAKVNADDRN